MAIMLVAQILEKVWLQLILTSLEMFALHRLKSIFIKWKENLTTETAFSLEKQAQLCQSAVLSLDLCLSKTLQLWETKMDF